MRDMVIRLTLVLATILALSIVAAHAVGPVAPEGAATTTLSLGRLADATPNPGRACPVTGDLVGGANPEQVARALCGDN